MLEAVLIADRIVVLHEGKLIEQGTPHALMTDARHSYVRELMQTPHRQAERLQALSAKDAP
jgi:osmoprotectant transport system ATP-binding protein